MEKIKFLGCPHNARRKFLYPEQVPVDCPSKGNYETFEEGQVIALVCPEGCETGHIDIVVKPRAARRKPGAKGVSS